MAAMMWRLGILAVADPAAADRPPGMPVPRAIMSWTGADRPGYSKIFLSRNSARIRLRVFRLAR